MRTMRILLCVLCLLVSSGCGALSQGRLAMPFGANAEDEAFKKAVAADSFPSANQAGIRAVSRP